MGDLISDFDFEDIRKTSETISKINSMIRQLDMLTIKKLIELTEKGIIKGIFGEGDLIPTLNSLKAYRGALDELKKR